MSTLPLLVVAAETEPVPWTDIPLVRILGAVLGILLLWAAIRAMFGGKGGNGRR